MTWKVELTIWKVIDATNQMTANMERRIFGRTIAHAANSGFKKLAVQWLIKHSTSHQHLWWLDSFELRNRQLLKPAKRWA